MYVVHSGCGGIAGRQPAPRSACLRRVREDGTSHPAWRDCGPTYDQLLALRAWRDEPRCPIVVLERMGGYWQPLSPVLAQTLEVVVAKARAVRQRPGKTTDTAEAAWLAKRCAHGRVEPRVLPPPAVHAWRDLRRTRVALVQTRTQGPKRLSTVLEDPNLTGAHAMSALCGTRGRRMLQAWCAGERHPKQRAAFAMGTVRRKVSELAWALTGQ